VDGNQKLLTHESRQAASYAARVLLHLSGTGRSSANSSPKPSMHAKKAFLACACAHVAASSDGLVRFPWGQQGMARHLCIQRSARTWWQACRDCLSTLVSTGCCSGISG
jgi:hypothetical protein